MTQASARAPEGHVAASGGLPGILRAGVLVAGAYGLILFAHGFLPGLISDAPTAYLSEASIRCLNDLGLSALTTWCHDYGEPLGYPLLTGGPAYGLGALLMYLPGVGSQGAYLLTGAVIDAVALGGAYRLMGRLGAGRLVAIGAATAYLLSPTTLGLLGFGGTFFGYALLPAYAYADLRMMDAVDRGRPSALALAACGYAAVRTAALFMDGYSFVAATLVGGALWLSWLLRRGRLGRQRAAGAAFFLGATAVAIVIYRLYVPGSYDQGPVEVFRAMGLDVVTLVVPSAWVWAAHKLDLFRDHQALWGDGSNSQFNYIGIVGLGFAIAYAARPPRNAQAVALGAAGLVALVLALGPSLKVDEVGPGLVAATTAEAYLMPEGVATADLPWDGIFTAVPGLDTMRASYRWFGVTRLAVIVLAGLAVARLAHGGRRRLLLAVALATVAMVEILPDLPRYTELHRGYDRSVERLTASVEADLGATTRGGERAFLLSYDGSHNDYLANYLAAGADLRVYNAGGDKNAALAQAQWPPEVLALAKPSPTPDEVEAALKSGNVDVVVAPYFHLRLSAYSWPPPAATVTQARAAYAALLADPRFDVEQRPWFATIRLVNPAPR